MRLYSSQVYTIDPSWSLGACKYPLRACHCLCVCMRVCSQARLALKVPPPLFSPLPPLPFPLSYSPLPVQAVKLSSSLLPSGRVKPSQTKHGQAARHSPHAHTHTHTHRYKHKNTSTYISTHMHTHVHTPMHMLGAGVRSCPTPRKP